MQCWVKHLKNVLKYRSKVCFVFYSVLYFCSDSDNGKGWAKLGLCTFENCFNDIQIFIEWSFFFSRWAALRSTPKYKYVGTSMLQYVHTCLETWEHIMVIISPSIACHGWCCVYRKIGHGENVLPIANNPSLIQIEPWSGKYQMWCDL